MPEVPLNATTFPDDNPKFVPVMAIVSPGLPLVGEKPVTVGSGTTNAVALDTV